MKRILFALILLSSFTIHAQKEVDKFQLTPEGLNGYVVLDFPGMSKEEIFHQLKKWAQYNIRDAKSSNYSEVENEYLTYGIIIPGAIELKTIAGISSWDLSMDAEYRIKPGRLRIDFNNIRFPGSGVERELEVKRGGLYGLYKKNGEVRDHYEGFVNRFDAVINEIVSEISQSIARNPDVINSDW